METKQLDLDIEGSELLETTLNNTEKVLIHKGGSSSSKTVSIAQAHIIWSFQEFGKTYSIVRKTLPALRRGALKDFKMALALAGCEDWFVENKSDLTFTNRQTGTVIEFFAIDNAQKARGPRRDRLWCNEGNELDLEDWRQLTMRTRGRIVLDYNPSMLQHWIYTDVETRSDCQVIHSTYQDNPFLTPDNIREIEVDLPVYALPDGSTYTDWAGTYEGKGTLLSGDPFRWAVFGLGKRGAASETIYKVLYDSAGLTPGRQRKLGLDFGFNHATVLSDLEYRDMPGKAELHIDELIHQSYLTSDDLIRMLPEVGVSKRDEIEADGARPEMIEAIKRAGYNIKAADKGPGSVKEGIDKLKAVKLCFTKRSKKSRDQFQMYRWKKTSSGDILDEPIKHEDDAPDSVRYGATSLIKTRTAPRRRSAQPSIVR
ncbi:PBSX family phage terminase large subunit [Hymenobacter glacieicola]|uniref:Terminase n=1 Tax=Hymenobacter glacieicola TaxID=1562124 RepID=A0ABQ1WJP2_9BACT|nr:phage terminase large subunit [Hymenobacter glacieicola]GGG34080.1 terminase [Hymenobacter glacieicola]